MQGIKSFIPSDKKASYINVLLQTGFDVIDFGSFVSPKAIPQMQDTEKVLSLLKLEDTTTELLSIVANERGAKDACSFEQIKFLGFPLSVSETFQQRNTNSSIVESLKRVEAIQALCLRHSKELVIYISMGFGNPYGDEWSPDRVIELTQKLVAMGIKTIALSDTIGISNPESISYLFSNLLPEFTRTQIGAHLHTTPDSWKEKMDAAYSNG
ncbi:MAG: hydroxymethylglutaryl-CoA lyase, partial [Flavobacteriales bacterium]|nr:hydroxymethylglutaryl-CoA lyase [Flavobacteriales bacterium]